MKPEETLLGIRIPKELKEELVQHCKENGLKIQFVVKQAIEERLQKINGKIPRDDGQNINSVGVDPRVDPGIRTPFFLDSS